MLLLLYVLVALPCIFFSKDVEALGQYCEEAGIQFKKGETITIPGECESFTCEEPGINLMLGKRCEKHKLKPGCKEKPGNSAEDFPKCCPTIVC